MLLQYCVIVFKPKQNGSIWYNIFDTLIHVTPDLIVFAIIEPNGTNFRAHVLINTNIIKVEIFVSCTDGECDKMIQ